MSLAGSVRAVTSADGILTMVADGHADLSTGTPMRDDTVFWIASLSKPITAAAVMLAVAEGLVTLDSPVTEYLPGFRPQMLSIEDDGSVASHEPRTPITLRMLLSHTAGLAFSSPVETPTFDLAPIATQVDAYSRGLLLAPPGTRFLYSNAGYNVAARVLEVVTGSAFETVLADRVFAPLGMHDTTFWPDPSRVATSYRLTADGTLAPEPISQLRYPLDDRTRFPFAGGGLFSTAADVAAFAQALLRGSLLPARAITEMTTPQLDDYGLGFALGADGSFGHFGAYGTALRVHPRQGLATVWMIQQVPAESPDPGRHAFEEFDQLAVAGS